MTEFRKYFTFVFAAASLSLMGYAMVRALHSELFLVKVVEVADQAEDAPLDAQAITDLAAVPVGKVNLYELDLSLVEKRLLKSSWISEVRLTKRFPQTLSIGVVFREPKALLQSEQGSLSYVDSAGAVFAPVKIEYRSDLPILSGMHHDAKRIKEALFLLDQWEKTPFQAHTEVSSLQWNEERGFRALVTYSLGASGAPAHTMIDFGSDADLTPDLSSQLIRVSEVLKYLGSHSVPARQIWADAGKKIVVKTARGS